VTGIRQQILNFFVYLAWDQHFNNFSPKKDVPNFNIILFMHSNAFEITNQPNSWKLLKETEETTQCEQLKTRK
jgi:hypothetical protein